MIGQIILSFFVLIPLSNGGIGNRFLVEMAAYRLQDMVIQTKFLFFTDTIMECISTNQFLNGEYGIISQTIRVAMANIEESQ